MLTGFAVGLARKKGVKLNEALAEEQLKTSVTIRSPEREGLFQGVSRGGVPMVDSLLLASMAAQHYRADRLCGPGARGLWTAGTQS